METTNKDNFCNTKKVGRPKIEQESILVTVRFRRGRSNEEDGLIDRLKQLPVTRQRSRFIRRVLTTGEIDAVLEREFARESARVTSALDAMGAAWDDED